MNIGILNDDGILIFSDFIDSLNTQTPLALPLDILEDAKYLMSSAPIEVTLNCKIPDSKHDVAKYLFEIINNSGIKEPEHNRGLWVWLSLYYFTQVCKKNSKGEFKPGARARWIPEPSNFQRYYRHLLAGPWRVFKTYSDAPNLALGLLAGSIQAQGDLFEQLVARQELVTNSSLVSTATNLYYDHTTNKLKRGAGGKGAGSPRRLADLISQFSLTWDLYSMTVENIWNLLPAEFDKFKSGT